MKDPHCRHDSLACVAYELAIAILLAMVGFSLLLAADIEELEATWPTVTIFRSSHKP